MSEEHELEKLVIKNISIVEQSCKLIEETIDTEFKVKISTLIKQKFYKIFPEWDLSLDLFDKECTFEFNPPQWYFKKADACCYFSVGFSGWDTLPFFSYLALCTNVENVEPGIWFCENDEFYNKFSPDFEKAICDLYVKNKERLDSAGFIFRDDELYRPFQLNLEIISAEWPNLSENSIKPLLEALESVSEVADVFDGLVKRLTG